MNKRPRVPESDDDSTVRSTESRERTYENHLEHQKSSFDHGTTRENALSAGRVEKLEKEKAVAHEHLRQARQDMHSLAEYSNQCQLERMEGAQRNHAQEAATFAASREEQLQTLAAGTARLLTRFQEQAAELADANGKLQSMALLQQRNAQLLKGKTHAEYSHAKFLLCKDKSTLEAKVESLEHEVFMIRSHQRRRIPAWERDVHASSVQTGPKSD